MLKVKLFDEKETKGLGQTTLPPGKYNFVVDHVEHGAASTGRPRLEVRLKVADGEFEGSTQFDWWNLTTAENKPTDFTPNFWRDIVKANPRCYSVEKEELDENALQGVRFSATVVLDTDNKGNERTRVRNYRFVAADAKKAAETPSAPKTFSAPPSS